MVTHIWYFKVNNVYILLIHITILFPLKNIKNGKRIFFGYYYLLKYFSLAIINHAFRLRSEYIMRDSNKKHTIVRITKVNYQE